MSLKKNNKIEVNWCGGKWSNFSPPYAVMFETDCNIHDRLYGEWGTEIDRKIADVYLLEYMKLDVSKLFFIKRPYFYMWAYLYYFAVRIFGKKYFSYKKRKWKAET